MYVAIKIEQNWSLQYVYCCETLATGDIYINYHIVGKFGELTLFEPLAKKFGELIDQPIDYLL